MSLRKYINHARLSNYIGDWHPASNIVILCPNNINSGGCDYTKAIFHELLLRCGAGNDPNGPEIATYQIVNECLQENCYMRLTYPLF